MRFAEIGTSAQLWGVVFKEDEKYDKTLVEGWKGDMDGILIFVRPSNLLSACPGIERTFADGSLLYCRRRLHHRCIQISLQELQ